MKPPQVDLVIKLNHTNAHGECADYCEKWFKYFQELGPVAALLKTPGLREDYFDVVNAKTRNMVRKAVKLGYHTGQLYYNDNLKEMYEINTSSIERQGRPMTSSYFEELAPIGEVTKSCESHKQIYYGVFRKDFKLVAYCWLAICSDIAIINRILGHADYLKDGIMNLLIAGLVHHAQNHGISYINYRTMTSSTEGLEKFKKHVGFKSVRIEVIR